MTTWMSTFSSFSVARILPPLPQPPEALGYAREMRRRGVPCLLSRGEEDGGGRGGGRGGG